MEDPDDMSAQIDYCEQDLHEIMGKPTPEELKERFNYHRPPNERVTDAHDFARNTLHSTASVILDKLPEGREASVFLTKMEEAMFWANAAIARNHAHYEDPEGEPSIVETAPPEPDQ